MLKYQGISKILIVVSITYLLAIQGCGRKVDDYLNEAQNLQTLGKLQQAEQVYLQVLKKYPKIPVIHNNIGTLYRDMKAYDKALDHFNKALELYTTKREKSFVLNNIGSVFDMKNDFEKAKIKYLEALDLVPENIDALNNLATILHYPES